MATPIQNQSPELKVGKKIKRLCDCDVQEKGCFLKKKGFTQQNGKKLLRYMTSCLWHDLTHTRQILPLTVSLPRSPQR